MNYKGEKSIMVIYQNSLPFHKRLAERRLSTLQVMETENEPVFAPMMCVL